MDINIWLFLQKKTSRKRIHGPEGRQAAGVDHSVTGTVTDLGTALNVNARTVAFETASITAMDTIDLDQDAIWHQEIRGSFVSLEMNDKRQ
jgi:hypothetical protein